MEAVGSTANRQVRLRLIRYYGPQCLVTEHFLKDPFQIKNSEKCRAKEEGWSLFEVYQLKLFLGIENDTIPRGVDTCL